MALSSGLWEEATWGDGGGGGLWVEMWGPLGQSQAPSSPLRLAAELREEWLFSARFPSCTFPRIQLCVNPFSSPGSQHQHPDIFTKYQPWLFFACHPAPRACKRPSSWEVQCLGERRHLLATGHYYPHSQAAGG